MTHHPKLASPLGNHSDVDDGPVPVLLIFSVSLIQDSNNNLVPDIEPGTICCKYKGHLVCLIQSLDYTGPIWLSCTDPEGHSYKWCIRLDKQGMAQKFWWGVPWNNTFYRISTNDSEPGGPTGTLVVGTPADDSDPSGRRT